MTINNKLKKFLDSHKFGERIKRDYYGGNNSGFAQDKMRFDSAKKMSIKLLALLGQITKEEMTEASQRAFMGRLEYKNKNFSYCPGQFYDLEVPQAVQAVLEYVKNNRIKII